jgi:hypothetical protein
MQDGDSVMWRSVRFSGLRNSGRRVGIPLAVDFPARSRRVKSAYGVAARSAAPTLDPLPLTWDSAPARRTAGKTRQATRRGKRTGYCLTGTRSNYCRAARDRGGLPSGHAGRVGEWWPTGVASLLTRMLTTGLDHCGPAWNRRPPRAPLNWAVGLGWTDVDDPRLTRNASLLASWFVADR